jgi:glycosyltransferase involved in cell wall biosynthesis
MRIVFIAFPNSIHAAKWVSLFAEQGWDLHLVPSVLYEQWVHPLFRNVTHWTSGPFIRSAGTHPSVVDKQFSAPMIASTRYSQWPWRSFWKARQVPAELIDRAQWTADLIRHLEPNIVHSLEFQHAGALALRAKQRYGPGFPKWIATNWGSDVYLFGRLAAHREGVREILRNCDYYSCECERDLALAKSFGLRGKVLPVVPNSGGIDIKTLPILRTRGPTSARRLIAVKGYHWTMHRAQVALRAIEMCADILKDYCVKVYSAQPPFMTDLQAKLITESTGVAIEFLPPIVSHDEILALHGSARVSISLSISDGLCTSFAEAMAMGSFPIQSATACADEWVSDGISAFLVPPEEPELIATSLRRAVLDDALVDRAAAINMRIAAERLDRDRIRAIAVRDYYEHVVADGLYERES